MLKNRKRTLLSDGYSTAHASVNKPTTSNGRQSFLTSRKGTVVRSFKRRLDVKKGITVFQHPLEKTYCFSSCCTSDKEKMLEEVQRSLGLPVLLLLSAHRQDDRKSLFICLPLPSSFFSVLACPVIGRTSISSGSEASEETQQVHTAQSKPENPAVAAVQLFPTATPKATPLPDSFITTRKPGLSKRTRFSQTLIQRNQTRDAKKWHCSPNHSNLRDSSPPTVHPYLF